MLLTGGRRSRDVDRLLIEDRASVDRRRRPASPASSRGCGKALEDMEKLATIFDFDLLDLVSGTIPMQQRPPPRHPSPFPTCSGSVPAATLADRSTRYLLVDATFFPSSAYVLNAGSRAPGARRWRCGLRGHANRHPHTASAAHPAPYPISASDRLVSGRSAVMTFRRSVPWPTDAALQASGQAGAGEAGCCSRRKIRGWVAGR